jgi:hypothetical protein
MGACIFRAGEKTGMCYPYKGYNESRGFEGLAMKLRMATLTIILSDWPLSNYAVVDYLKLSKLNDNMRFW